MDPHRARPLGVLMVATALVMASCMTSDVPVDPDVPVPASPSPSGAVDTGPSLASLGYLDNLLARAADGDWTLDVGLDSSLRLLLGGAAQTEVLRDRPLGSYDMTGIIAAGREWVAENGRGGASQSVAGLVDLLDFDHGQLEAMVVDPLAPPPTVPAFTFDPSVSQPTPGATDVGEVSEPPLDPDYETDCERFFRQFRLGEGTTRCLSATPIDAPGFAYAIYYPTPSIATFGWEESYRGLVTQAMTDAVSVYEDLGTLPSVDVVLAANLDVPGYGASMTDDAGCRLVLYPDAQRLSEPEFKQVVALELAHCLQEATFAPQSRVAYAARAWREDGLAAYLSNLVYPDPNLEWQVLTRLLEVDEVGSLVRWSAGTFVWWQYLANEEGWEGIRQLVGSLPAGGDIEDQSVALSAWLGPKDLGTFETFAQAYIDGQIIDESGASIPTAWTPPVEEQDGFIGAAGTALDLSPEPFGLEARLLVTGPDRVALRSDPGGLQLRSRPLSGQEWGPLPEVFPAECLADNQLLILATRRAGAADGVGQVSADVLERGC